MEPMGYLERTYISMVLNDCLDQLCILGHIQLSYGDSDFSADEGLKTMELKDIAELENDRKGNMKYVKWRRAVNLTRPAIALNALVAMIWDHMMSFRNLTKLGRTHKLLELVIAATREEIENKGTFPCMQAVIVEEKRRKKKYAEILQVAISSGKRIVELSRQCQQLARERQQYTERHNEIAGILKISYKKLKFKAFCKLVKEHKFSNVHVEQEVKKIGLAKDDIMEEFNSIKEATKREFRIGGDICRVLDKRHAELDEMLEFWVDRYEKKIDESQRRLEVLRCNRRQQWNHTFDLLHLSTSYGQIVEEHARERKESEVRRVKQQLQSDAVVKIQTWWRFTMVRKQMGPFRLKKRGKDKKKGKKGKKK